MHDDDLRRPLPREAFLRAETYRRTRLPVSLATTLIPDAYTSPEFHELERDRIFATSWVAAGPRSELAEPGDTLVVEVGGSSVIVVCGADGEVRAFHNVCRHRGTQLLDEWQVVRAQTYEIEANYKLVGENFMEYYHLPWVHPQLIKVSPIKAHYRWQGSGMYTGMTTTPIAAADGGGWLGLPPIDGLPESERGSARFVWLFPKLAVNVLPNHVFLMAAQPV